MNLQPKAYCFPPSQRLHNSRDYGRVFYRQQKGAGRHTVILVSPRPKHLPQAARLGIMVSTKVHKRAVRRHQLKRWVREWFRCGAKELALGYDVVVLFRSNPPSDGHAALGVELNRLLAKALAAVAAPGSGNGRRKGGKAKTKGKGVSITSSPSHSIGDRGNVDKPLP